MESLASANYVDHRLADINVAIENVSKTLLDKYVTFGQMDGEIQKCCDELSKFFLKRTKYEHDFAETDRMLAAMRTMDKKAVNGINELNDYVEVLRDSLSRKVDQKVMDRLVESQKKFIVYEDLKDLYDKVIPPLKAFDEEIQDISKEQEQ